jgi:hypothetical protein
MLLPLSQKVPHDLQNNRFHPCPISKMRPKKKFTAKNSTNVGKTLLGI